MSKESQKESINIKIGCSNATIISALLEIWRKGCGEDPIDQIRQRLAAGGVDPNSETNLWLCGYYYGPLTQKQAEQGYVPLPELAA